MGSSPPAVGYLKTSVTWACSITDGVGSYQVQVFNSTDEVVAVSNDVSVSTLSGKYVDGLCEVSAEFSDIPMVGGPFTARYFADGEDTGRSEDFDIEDLTAISGS